MKPYQKKFIEFALKNQVLSFGEFTLKSGRKSPYFINSGMFRSGKTLSQLGEFYADAIEEHFKGKYDVLFGPAYKGIPIVVATSMWLNKKFGLDAPFSFNRKEAKDHGEGGVIVGEPVDKKRAVLVDDVISAGTAKREAIDLLKHHHASVTGIMIAVDRQEKGLHSDLSSVQEIQNETGIPVAHIVSLTELIEYLREDNPLGADTNKHLENILEYKKQYGV